MYKFCLNLNNPNGVFMKCSQVDLCLIVLFLMMLFNVKMKLNLKKCPISDYLNMYRVTVGSSV